MDDHLGVAGRLEDRAAPVQLAPHPHRVRDVTVVRDRETARGEIGIERLHVAQAGAPRRRIADMADRGTPGQLAQRLFLAKYAGDVADAAMAVEILAVEAGDPGRLLAAMLERVQAERGHPGGVVRAEDAKNAAFLAELVVIGIGDQHLAREAGGAGI